MNTQKKREPMSNVDAAWRHMEHPTNLMMVTGIMHFRESLPLDRLHTIIERQMLVYPRFKQRVIDVGVLKVPHWELDDSFSLDNHISEHNLDDPGDKETLEIKVSELMSMQLDFEKPLWHFHLIHNVEGGNAVFIRVHHCIADGIALIGLLLSLTANTKEESEALLRDYGGSNQPARESSKKGILTQAGAAIGQAGRFSGKLFQGGLEALGNPSKLLELAKQGGQGVKAATKLVTRSADPQTILRGPLGVPKRATWSKQIPLDRIKSIGKVTKTTVNDVLIAAMAGGLRHYLHHREQTTDGLNFRAAVPVNMRAPERWADLGNHFGLVFLSMPMGINDPLDRLWEVKKRMDYLKTSGEAAIVLGILKTVGMTPAEIQKMMVNVFGSKTTCVLTNVPGPRQPLYLAGSRIDDIMFWVPCSGRLGLGISILSYAGSVRVGIATDHGLIPDPGLIAQGFEQELDAMHQLVDQVH